MDGRGRFSDNIFVERLWRNLKYEKIYLSGYQNAAEARHSIAAYFDFLTASDCMKPWITAPRPGLRRKHPGVAKPGQGRKAAGANH